MKIAFVVNDIMTEKVDYSTTHMALQATVRGHEVWYVNLSDLSYDPDEQVHAMAVGLGGGNYTSTTEFLRDLQSDRSVHQRLTIDALDVLMLRNDPAEDVFDRPWARLAGINFGRLATRHGVIVLNDPDGLNHVINKTYLQYFPKSVRPRSFITRSKEDIRAFARAEGGTIVIKPLAGSGGRNVFLIRPEDAPNFSQMIEAVLRDGFVIAQEYLPQAVEGDTRLLMMNGTILQYEGKFAAVHRVGSNADMRSNLTAGGTRSAAQLTKVMFHLAETVGPRLKSDGIFLAGLDIVGDKILEINVFSPGTFNEASEEAGANFLEAVIAALEKKVAHRDQHKGRLSNAELAVF